MFFERCLWNSSKSVTKKSTFIILETKTNLIFIINSWKENKLIFLINSLVGASFDYSLFGKGVPIPLKLSVDSIRILYSRCGKVDISSVVTTELRCILHCNLSELRFTTQVRTEMSCSMTRLTRNKVWYRAGITQVL